MCSEVHCALDLNMCGRALGAHTVWSDPLASPCHSCVRDAIFYLLLSPDIQTLIIIICQLNFRVLIETIYGIFRANNCVLPPTQIHFVCSSKHALFTARINFEDGCTLEQKYY